MGIKDLGVRVKRVRNHLEKSVLEFSTEMDLTIFDLEEIETGKKRPTQELLRRITRRYSINYYWLTTGEVVSDPIIPNINESWD